jgi:hypothetical protein
MRTVTTGFLLGYLVVGFLIAPSVLCALNLVPNYASGVTVVLERTGVSRAIKQSGQQLVEIRDRANQKLAAKIDRLIFQRPPN